MKNFALLIKKELWENWVNWKTIIVFVFFMALGVIGTYSRYQNALQMKASFQSSSSLITGGLEYNIAAGDLISPLFLFVGVAVTIIAPLMLMSTVAHEVQSGQAASILVKPVRRTAYILSKFIVYLSIFWLAIISSVLISIIYANSVADVTIDMGQTWRCIGLSLIFALFCISFMLFLSSITRNQLIAGGIGIILLFFMSSTLYSPEVIFTWMPSKLLEWCQNIINNYTPPWDWAYHYPDLGMDSVETEKYTPAWIAFGFSIISSVILLVISVMFIKRKEL
ncbi:MAG: ABC transporter permease [Chloroflexi bacterium]|nr:ABC transporter permease [Chloroflexota bacterium]